MPWYWYFLIFAGKITLILGAWCSVSYAISLMAKQEEEEQES